MRVESSFFLCALDLYCTLIAKDRNNKRERKSLKPGVPGCCRFDPLEMGLIGSNVRSVLSETLNVAMILWMSVESKSTAVFLSYFSTPTHLILCPLGKR